MQHTKYRILFVLGLSFNGLASESEEKHHHDFSPALHAFHDALSPLWHAEPSIERQQQTCAAIDAMQTLASKVNDGADLMQSLTDLQTYCDQSQHNFDQAFSKVHDEFHALID